MVRFRGGCRHISFITAGLARDALRTLHGLCYHSSLTTPVVEWLTELIRLTDSPKTVFESARGLFSGGEQKFTEGGFSLFYGVATLTKLLLD